MQNSGQPDLQQLRVGMQSTNERFNTEVFGKRNFDALEEIYTANARILPPGGEIMSGRKAIKEFWSNLIQSVNAKSAVLTSIDVMPAGDGAVEIGLANLIIEPEENKPTEMGVKYVVYWKQENGHWR